MKRTSYLVAATMLFLASSTGVAATITVSSLGPVITPAGNAWGRFVVGGGTAEIVDLTGVGGNLELSQPLPTHALRLTTGGNNADRGEAGISADFGDASTILTDLIAGYSYYKVNSGNTFAAPSLKLSIFAPGGTGDNFGQLIYEPTWNLGAGSQPPPTGAWQNVAINANTGAGDTTTGGWWWTGGFLQPSGAGGPPIRSAAEWNALFAADPDYSNARIVGINVGVGTFNLNQIGYVDNITLSAIDQPSVTYDFEAASTVVPEPTSCLMFLGLGCCGVFAWSRRSKREGRQG